MTITANDLVGNVATENPLATRVFARHNIDFCCGGGRPLAEVCAEKGLNPDTVVAEIEDALKTTDTSKRWDNEPLGDLIDHILSAYHEPLWEEMPRLEAMAHKVNTVHGHRDPERLGELAELVTAMKDELSDHMKKEEQVLFPLIKGGGGASATMPINVMNHEHETAGAQLKRLRELTNDFTVPEEACNTWRALWHGLEAFESDLHEHIHLENNILFPGALAGKA